MCLTSGVGEAGRSTAGLTGENRGRPSRQRVGNTTEASRGGGRKVNLGLCCHGVGHPSGTASTCRAVNTPKGFIRPSVSDASTERESTVARPREQEVT